MDLQGNRNPSQMSSPFRSKPPVPAGFTSQAAKVAEAISSEACGIITYLLPAQSFEM